MQGTIDIPLNETGRRIAQLTAKELSKIPFDLIISSPLSRAVETARIVTGYADIPLKLDMRLRELSWGEWEGLTQADLKEMGYKEGLNMFFTDPFQFPCPPGGDSIQQVCERGKQFFEEVVASAKEGKAVLWHCTAGKDRTGIEAMLLMAALGCDYSTILNEFLQTNVYYEEKAQASYDKVYKLIPIKAIANEFYKYEIVRKTWLQDVSMEVMKRETNTDNYEDALEAYLLNVIELDPADREILRNAYLVGYESSIGVSDDRTQSLILESAA